MVVLNKSSSTIKYTTLQISWAESTFKSLTINTTSKENQNSYSSKMTIKTINNETRSIQTLNSSIDKLSK
jgi:hypothetical protein